MSSFVLSKTTNEVDLSEHLGSYPIFGLFSPVVKNAYLGRTWEAIPYFIRFCDPPNNAPRALPTLSIFSQPLPLSLYHPSYNTQGSI